mmetsp:Transcript_182121/g.443142  ORF Transcript_182121/g.443142 Transcript_182121/m.443142 type:complete len:475 (+) Transcript_182121:3-1427(+)
MKKSKRRQLEEEEPQEEVAEEEEDAPKAKKKGKRQEEDEEAVDPAPSKAKKVKRKEQAEEAPEPQAAATSVKAKKSKRREQVEEAAEADPDADLETATAAASTGGKKRNKQRQVEASSVPEVDAPDADVDEEKPSAKKRKGRREEVEEENVDEEKPSKKAKKKHTAEDDADKKPSEKVSSKSEAQLAPELLTVFVGGIPWSCTAKVLQKDFEECGKVVDVNLLTDKVTGKSRGFAFVSFADEPGVQAALKYDGEDYGGKKLKVYRAEASAVREAAASRSDLEVFVKGLPADTTEESLRKRFSDCGALAKLNLPTRGSGKCKGFAWLTFTSKADMDKALGHNDEECGSAKLLVEASSEHKQAADGDSKGKGKGKGKGKVSTEREVFASNLPYEATEADLRKDFGECGEIERMHMPMRDTKCMGFAWITFTTQEGVDKALGYNGDEYGGRRLKVEKSGQHRAGSGKDKGGGKGGQE